VGIEFVMERLPFFLRRLVYRLLLVLMALLMAVIVFYAIIFARATWDQLMPTLNLSTGLFYVILAYCGVHSILHFVHLFGSGKLPQRGFD